MTIIKIIYVVLGSISLGLGVLGIALPILPTTPFLLLTLYFYAKGSTKFHDWFISTKLYKLYLEDFATNRAMTLKQKITLMIFVDIMLLFPFILLEYLWVKPLIIALIIIKYYYFFTQVETIPRKKPPM
ncbi:MAG: YbaN family protein [Candidatus Izemoplasmataceae bacterium]